VTKGIRVYTHGLDKQGKRWKLRHSYPSAYKVARCIELATGKHYSTIMATGFEEGALTLHLKLL
jgi:hypothetical protein